LEANRDATLNSIIADYVADRSANPDGTRVAMAHRRRDVAAINAGIRAALQARDELAKGTGGSDDRGVELSYQTTVGKRSFARGDRIVFLENNRDLGVKNGMLGEVIAVAPDAIQVRLDGKAQAPDGQRHLTIPVKSYQAFDNGYATIHKTQGATVDRSFVLASATMDRHLTYVAMTRHREAVQLYAALDEFKTMGSLSETLSRSGAKETTLDYSQTLGGQRGLGNFGGEGRGDRAYGDVATQAQHDRTDPLAMPTYRSAHSGAKGMSPGGRPEEPARGHDRHVLIPAIAKYEHSVDDVAREKAMPAFERDWETARPIARRVFSNADMAMKGLRGRILDGTTDLGELTRQLQSSPQTIGALVGRTGIFGDNAERRRALGLIKGLASHVEQACKTWQRRLEAERSSERWKREKQDVIVVPGFSQQSEVLLRKLDGLSSSERQKAVADLTATPEGRKALDEAKEIANSIEKRVGRAYAPDLAEHLKRAGSGQIGDVERIRDIARLADRSHHAELTQQMELKRSFSLAKSLGSRM
jgi:hypothetical protein